MLLPVEIKNHPCMSGGACQCGGSCGGCGRQAALKPRLGSLDGYRVGYQKNADLNDDIDRFGKDYPYHNDLSHIEEREQEGRRVRVGNSRFEIPGRRAGMLVRLGYAVILHGLLDIRTLSITAKGEKYLDRSQDALDRL